MRTVLGQRIVDVSHTVEHGMVTYKGLPAPVICDHLSRKSSRAIYTSGTEFQIGRIDRVGNAGTYVDSPFHRHPGRMDLADLPLSSLANLPCVVVRVPPGRGRAITNLPLEASDIRDHAVLIHAGCCRTSVRNLGPQQSRRATWDLIDAILPPPAGLAPRCAMRPSPAIFELSTRP